MKQKIQKYDARELLIIVCHVSINIFITTFNLFLDREKDQILVRITSEKKSGRKSASTFIDVVCRDQPFVVDTIARELAATQRYRQEQHLNLFAQIIQAEEEDGRRVLFSDDHWLGFVPYFAKLPYEMYLLPRSDMGDLRDCSRTEIKSLASGLKILLTSLDQVWKQPQPYILTIHQAPVSESDTRDYRCHIQILPMMRAPGLQKFLAGMETGAGQFLNDGSPEQKAIELRQAQSLNSSDP